VESGFDRGLLKRYKGEDMQSQKEEEISSDNKGRRPYFYVALGAIFLLVGMGFWMGFIERDSSGAGSNIVLSPYFQEKDIALSARVSLDAAGAAEDPAFIILGSTSLVGTVPPIAVTPQILGSILGEAALETKSTKEIAHYAIEEGDTVEGIAERFEVSVHTILWANDLSSSSALTPGEEIIVLPVSGALHLIRPGDTLSEVALWYKADMEDILDFNGLDSAQDIFVGDILIVPGGRKPSKLPNGRLTPVGESYFIYPIPRSYKITQGRHPFNAIDFANGSCGGPVYAAAGGTAQVVGYNGGLGNYVRILHPNGVVTVYAHLSGHAVRQGEKTLQGQIIGYVGHTGRTIPAGSAGCHLHFEVRGATNPFAR
jgi:murein DD-endopeptidase MepM/ murein hydrolase activator NlpD